MSNFCITWASQVRQPLTSMEQFCLEVLADYANDQHECWPSMTTVARRMRCHRATVYRLLESLEHRHGLIAKKSRGRGRGASNVYRLRVTDQLRLPTEILDEFNERLVPEKVASRDNLLSTSVAECDKGVVAQRDEGLSRDATRVVAPDATRVVAPNATRTLNNPHDPSGDDRFALDEHTKEVGAAGLALMRARLAASATTAPEVAV